MDYEALSNEELGKLIQQKLPYLGIKEVDDLNRQTIIACLIVSEGYPKDTTSRLALASRASKKRRGQSKRRKP